MSEEPSVISEMAKWPIERLEEQRKLHEDKMHKAALMLDIINRAIIEKMWADGEE